MTKNQIIWIVRYKCKFFFAWYDFWIGFFYDQKKRILYICPFPCVVIKIERNQSDGEKTVEAKMEN